MMEKITVMKIGGNVIDNPEALKAFLAEFAAIEGPKILVHGGGKLATRLAERLERKPLLRPLSPLLSHLLPQFPILRQFPHRIPEFLPIRTQKTGLPRNHRFPRASAIMRDHRATQRHGLDGHDPEMLIARRVNQRQRVLNQRRLQILPAVPQEQNELRNALVLPSIPAGIPTNARYASSS